VNVVASQPANWNRKKAAELAMNMLKGDPAIYCPGGATGFNLGPISPKKNGSSHRDNYRRQRLGAAGASRDGWPTVGKASRLTLRPQAL
jgi:hypothetical protein